MVKGIITNLKQTAALFDILEDKTELDTSTQMKQFPGFFNQNDLYYVAGLQLG